MGDFVETDEIIAVLETEKTTVDFRAESAGQLTKLFSEEGAEINVEENFVEIDTSVKGGDSKPAAKETPKEAPKQETQQQAPKQEAPKQAPKQETTKESPKQVQKETPSKSNDMKTSFSFSREEKRVPLNKMRKTIAARLKNSQNENATLTTFNECDMGKAMDLRKKYQEDFVKKHGIKLGLMSFFLRASTIALMEMPVFNSVIENGTHVVQRNFVDISVAVASPNGLLVPVIRNCSNMNFADFELELSELGKKARENKITIEDMQGGNFTVSNGGVYGSMLGTPIINPPQTAILGMHNIVNRPVVYKGEIVARPIMYLALSYDHRLVDGRESVTFLKRIKELVEEPEKLLLDL